jgi:hypothetical protein
MGREWLWQFEQDNRDRINAQQRVRHERNRDKRNAYQREYKRERLLNRYADQSSPDFDPDKARRLLELRAARNPGE